MIIYSKSLLLEIRESANLRSFSDIAMRILLIITFLPLALISALKNNKLRDQSVSYKFGIQLDKKDLEPLLVLTTEVIFH